MSYVTQDYVTWQEFSGFPLKLPFGSFIKMVNDDGAQTGKKILKHSERTFNGKGESLTFPHIILKPEII